MMKTRDSVIQWLEANLLEFATETGGSCGNTTAHRTALHILDGLARNYTDLIVEEAREYWDIEYRRELPARVFAPANGNPAALGNGGGDGEAA